MSPSVEGTPQGGPLSPLLSNLVLDELDRELEHRGHRFARYADDSNIYVRSERAGQRVMESITNFITTQLKLKVNSEKVRWGNRRSGNSWALALRAVPNRSGGLRRRQGNASGTKSGKSRRKKGNSMKQRVEDLTQYLRG